MTLSLNTQPGMLLAYDTLLARLADILDDVRLLQAPRLVNAKATTLGHVLSLRHGLCPVSPWIWTLMPDRVSEGR